MNQSQVEAWIAANGGSGAVQYNSSNRRIRNPARLMTNADGSDNPNYDPNAPEWLDVAEESWTNSKTGATLRVARRPDNSFDVLENKSADPNKKDPESKPTTIATNTTEPYIVQAMPDGTLRTTPNPNYRGPEQKPGTTHFATGGDGKVYAIPIGADGKPGKAVDVGLPAKPQEGQVVNVGNGRLVRVLPGGQAQVIYDNPNTKPEQDKDGQWYVVDKDAAGKPIIRYIQPQGQPTGQGPALPVLVLGQVQSGLRTYKDQLNQQVASGVITPAVADKRWKEATDLGTFAIKESETFQRDEESRRNADVNLRTNAMSNATSGFNSALSFVEKLNATLPEGSTAGGAAFEAILGLQQLNAKRMGAYDSPYSGGSAGRSQEARGIDAAAQSAVGTATSTINGLLNQPPAPVPTPPNASGAGAIGNQPAPPAAPAAPAVSAPAMAAPQLPEATPGGGPPAPTGAPGFTPPATGQPARGPYDLMPVTPNTPPAVLEPIPVAPNEGPLTGPNDPRMQPLGSPAGGNVQMAPPDDFAALAQFEQPRAPVYPALGAPDPGPEMAPVAMQRAQIAATPPWRLDDATYQWAVANGLENEFWQVPGAVA